MRALFIGGVTTAFKLGPRIEQLVAETRHRGIWIHMGRVNSIRCLAYARLNRLRLGRRHPNGSVSATPTSTAACTPAPPARNPASS